MHPLVYMNNIDATLCDMTSRMQHGTYTSIVCKPTFVVTNDKFCELYFLNYWYVDFFVSLYINNI